jgi:DNA-binding NtrC family response regulator
MPQRTSSREHILVIDDEPLIRQTLSEFLSQQGYEVSACGTGEEALQKATDRRWDLVLCDMNLPGIDGIEVLRRLMQIDPELIVLLITAYATVENAVEAFQLGAADYLMKPVILDEVLAKVKRLLTARAALSENLWLRRELALQEESPNIVVVSNAMRKVLEMAQRVATTRSTVLLQGESGTGKELIARRIHQQSMPSMRRTGASEPRFLAVNCAALPPELLENQLFGHRRGAFTGADRDRDGIFVHAGSGTVFLDEIGELPLGTQAKLLRALEEKEVLPVGANEPVPVDARILAATNKDLRKEVDLGRFRADLYFRLNVVTISIPPLRDRRDDIPPLAEAIVARHAREMGRRVHGVSYETMQILLACPWRGNVRELDNALQRALILGDGPLITPADLPPDLVPQPLDPALVDDYGEAVARFERQHIQRILAQTTDKKEAAKRLGMALSSLYRKVAELGISTEP